MLMSVFAAGWVGNCYAAGDPLCYPILSSWIMAGALVMAMGASFVTLMAAQFVTSLRVRFARVVTAVYNAEISPASLSWYVMQIFVNVGILLTRVCVSNYVAPHVHGRRRGRVVHVKVATVAPAMCTLCSCTPDTPPEADRLPGHQASPTAGVPDTVSVRLNSVALGAIVAIGVVKTCFIDCGDGRKASNPSRSPPIPIRSGSTPRPADSSVPPRPITALPGRRNSSNSCRARFLSTGDQHTRHHGVRRTGSGGTPPQGLVSVLLSLRSPEGIEPVGNAGLFRRHSWRRISTFQPLCMGRRSCKIAGRKVMCSSHDIGHVVTAVQKSVIRIKKGGPSPSSNTALAAILEKARELDIPKEILERNIKRASEKDQDTYTEKVYEVYGFGGVGMIVEVLTDKITRSVADIRNVVKDCGAKLADPGSVTFRFRQARVVNIKVTDADKDQLLSIALDAGADDVLEPNFDYDDDSEEEIERFYKIVTTSENYPVVLSKLQEEGLKFETDNGYELLPLNPIENDGPNPSVPGLAFMSIANSASEISWLERSREALTEHTIIIRVEVREADAPVGLDGSA
nr:unnamed protein product [Digitaria exilis]